MANIRLVDNTWDTSGIYDVNEEKTQRTINAEVKETIAGIGDLTELETQETGNLVAAVNEVNTIAKAKADPNGQYDSMTVGNAKQLVATVGVEDNVPYNFRTSGGSADIGDRETDMIVGGTIAWNQFSVKTKASSTAYGITTVISDGLLSISGTPSQATGAWRLTANNITIPQGHKVLLFGKTEHFYFRLQGDTANTTLQKAAIIFTANSTLVRDVVIMMSSLDTTTNYNESVYVQVFDLTQMFGSAIADYISVLETANAGAGVAWFRKFFPKPYYAYDAGSLQSVNVSAHNMVGFNAWDEEWQLGYWNAITGVYTPVQNEICSKNPIRILPNTVYNGKINQTSFAIFYDASGNYVGYGRPSGNFTTPTNAYYMHINCGSTYGTTYRNDICINLSWDGERDGEYEPYELHSYPLDSSLTLRGIPKLDSGNNLYYDGDTYESDGTVTRKYGIVDLGTLTWVRASANMFYSFGIKDTAKFPSTNTQKANTVSSQYVTFDFITLRDSNTNGTALRYDDTTLRIKNMSIDTVEAITSALSGVYLVYELASSTTEEADPYQNPQIVNDFGTEEYVDAGVTATTPTRDVAIPVGHETVYAANLRAKLEMAPDSPDGDGDYIVRQDGGVNTYVPLVIPNELPDAPSSDGTYKLQLSVSDGTATLSWVSAT